MRKHRYIVLLLYNKRSRISKVLLTVGRLIRYILQLISNAMQKIYNLQILSFGIFGKRWESVPFPSPTLMLPENLCR